MTIWAYVFVTTAKPRAAVQAMRKIAGVARADALFGTPEAIAIVEGDDLGSMDAAIDRIVALPEVVSTDTRVARWIE